MRRGVSWAKVLGLSGRELDRDVRREDSQSALLGARYLLLWPFASRFVYLDFDVAPRRDSKTRCPGCNAIAKVELTQ